MNWNRSIPVLLIFVTKMGIRKQIKKIPLQDQQPVYFTRLYLGRDLCPSSGLLKEI